MQLRTLSMYCQQLTFIDRLFPVFRRLRLCGTIFRRGRRHCCLKKDGNDVTHRIPRMLERNTAPTVCPYVHPPK